MQIFKNSGAREVIVSNMQTELHGSVSRRANLAESSLTIITFENFISSWKLGIVYAYRPDERIISIAQFGILLTKLGLVV
jgi:hypothetical protein